jgi:vancomycin resistance protein YoaR
MLNTSVNGIQNAITSGFGDVQTALCGGFAGVNATVNATTNSITSQMYNDTIANLERSFATQTANTAGLTNLSQQLSQCCCDNRLATCQTQNLVATESAATRLAIQEQTNAILDKLCQQEIDNLKAQNIALQNQVNMQSLAASQATQTAALIADNTAQTQYIVNRVAPYPIPAYIVANPVTPSA